MGSYFSSSSSFSTGCYCSSGEISISGSYFSSMGVSLISSTDSHTFSEVILSQLTYFTVTFLFDFYPFENKYNFEAGDMIYRSLDTTIAGWAYSHYGVYIGRDEVIDYGTSGDGKGIMRRVSVENFSGGKDIYVQKDFSKYPRKSKSETRRNALVLCKGEERDSWKEYSVSERNCEHFANYCATGEIYATQSVYFNKYFSFI